jgi:hypothetical protein
MGQQQLLLIMVGAIVVCIAVAVGISLFGGNSAQANQDGITAKLTNIAADAAQYKLRPKTLGGGRPSYAGYMIPQQMRADDNGTYEVSGSISDTHIAFIGKSSVDASWTAICDMDSTAHTTITYTGW